ncbi:MMPL family transporter [Microbacterium sp. SS28]|uniref:MMPL family transporter n=1 Tax=Microbacterium sp. SS28 TaxID=2919948 RepID=UPI001FA9A612|nr:MMPL family transporter [Microbacterium sp. SS28]
MSTLLYALGRWSYRHPWRVLVAWLLLLGIAGGSAAAFTQGTDNTFSIPGTEAQAGIEQLSRSFPQASGTSGQLVVVAAEGDSVDEEPYSSAIEDTIARLEDLDGVLAVTDPFNEFVSGLVSDDASAAIIRLQFDGQATDVTPETKEELADISADFEESLPEGSQVAIGGDLYSQSVPAISLIEAVGVLVALFVLIVAFRSFAVAWFPLVTALIGVALAISLIFVATAFASISSTTPLLAIMLGLAVGIDYALFIIARHQDQVRAGVEPEESAARATGTAGSAVVFAGVTVLIALIGLSIANIPFLTTMGIAASVAVAIAVLVALTLSPALLGFAKGRVVGWKRRGARTVAPVVEEATVPAETAAPARASKRHRRGFSEVWVGGVTRHPVITTIAVVVGLGILAIPAASLRLALPNAGMQPETSEARQAYDLTSEHFGPGFNGPLILTGTIVTSTDPLGLMEDLGDAVLEIPGVKAVALAVPNETADTGIVQLVPETAPDDPATADLVRELRSHHDEWLEEFGVDLKVTGFTAVAIDISDRLGGALLPFGIFVVGLSLVLLTIVFRSIWVPIKAALGYLLSVLAAFGVIALVFEWGWFGEALHVAKTGPIISFMPIILMGVLFGLAMDYEVFLVSRMREDYVHKRRDNGGVGSREIAVGAVRSGFTASARVVTAAAVIMFAVFAAFIPEGDTAIKPIALGLAAGIAIDAFLVRMTLVPAVMTLLGDRAWWMPRWLDRVLPHFDIEGEAVERELALANWPEPDTTAVVAAELLDVSDEGRTLVTDVTFRVEPRESLVVTSDSPASATGLLLAVAGRLAPTDGRLRVAGHLLPERAAWVRAHVGVALLHGAQEPLDDLRRALRGRTSLVVVDGIDALTPAERTQAAGMLRDAASVALVVSATDAAVARALLADAGRAPLPTLDVSRTPALSAAEVTL